MDVIFDLAKNFLDVQYNDIPREVIETTRKEVLDTLGVALGGSSRPGIKELIDVVKEDGGKHQSTVIGYGLRMPVSNAAQINATMSHALDFDNAHDGAVIHPGVITVMTSFAMAECMGGLTGREFILAIVLGDDLICRLGMAARSNINPMLTGWHNTTLLGFLCAAAISGRILSLDLERMVNAFGIAYHQCSGNGQAVIDGSMTKRMGPGFAVKGGIIAALMAERGITGANNCLEGKFGMFKQYYRVNCDAKALVADLGQKFEGINISMKPYPCCRGVHLAIDATLALVNEFNVKAVDVEKVNVVTGEATYLLLCDPIESKRNPRNLIDTQFSIPWAVAVAIAKRKVSIEDFSDNIISDRQILEISNKIYVEIDKSLNRSVQLEPVRIDIKLRNGTQFSKQFDIALGSPERPMSFEECMNKFKDCAMYSVNTISNKKINKVVKLIEQLEELTDVTEILRVVS